MVAFGCPERHQQAELWIRRWVEGAPQGFVRFKAESDTEFQKAAGAGLPTLRALRPFPPSPCTLSLPSCAAHTWPPVTLTCSSTRVTASAL